MEKPQSTTFDNQLIELESVDSTNNYAMGQIHAGLAKDGMVCLAHFQTAGRGQREKTWKSEAGMNLMMSLVIEPGSLILRQQFLFSASVALGIMDCLRTYELENWRIKWPNDIYWNDRKAAGILIENLIQGQNWPFSVVGIGINLNQEQFSADIPNAVALKEITGTEHAAVDVARKLVPFIQQRITLLRQDPFAIFSEYNLYLYKSGQPVSLKKGRDMILTRIDGVDHSGSLLTQNGRFSNGEVEWIVDG